MYDSEFFRLALGRFVIRKRINELRSSSDATGAESRV